MSTFSVYATDKTKEEEGTWVSLADGSQVKVARTNSRRAIEARNKARKPHEQAIQRAERLGHDLPEWMEEEIALEMTINGILIDWDGVTDKDGSTLECTEDNARYVLKELPEFHSDVIQAASSIANFHDSEVEEASKN